MSLITAKPLRAAAIRGRGCRDSAFNGLHFPNYPTLRFRLAWICRVAP